MRKVKHFLSGRGLNLKARSWDIVFEWEDILSRRLNIEIKERKRSLIEYVLQRLKIFGIINNHFFKKSDISLQFVTDVRPKAGTYMDCNVIPIIIDFWMVEECEIKRFIDYFKNVPLLLVSNIEVLFLLEKFNCPFPVEHFPLSLPDYYKLSDNSITAEKVFEFGFIGRIDTYFKKYIEKYSETHQDFEYVYSKGYNWDREYWTNKGKSLGKDKGRESYIEYLQKTKITCYSTPGIDESKKETSCFNQVTPRVLEMLSNGCQVIGHYPLSEDVKWYNLSSVVPNVNTYEQFEMKLDEMRKQTFDYNNVSVFLDKHYTSQRATLLRDILMKYDLL